MGSGDLGRVPRGILDERENRFVTFDCSIIIEFAHFRAAWSTLRYLVMPGAASSVLAPSSDGLQPSSDGLHRA